MKNISSRPDHDKLHFFWCTIILLTAISFSSTLLAGQDCVSKPSPKLLNPQLEFLNPKSVNSNPSNPQSAIQKPVPDLERGSEIRKADIIQRTQRLQMPFIANEGQTDEKVAFYANTFGGAVFVTKDGEIVYSLPMVAHASPLVHYDIDKNETGYTGLTGYMGKEGQCIVHRTLCTMYPYCTWNFPVYYSETNSSVCNTESNFPVCHSERSEESHLNNSQSAIPNPKSVNSISSNPKSAIQNLSPTSTGEPKSGVSLREEFVGAKVKTIQGEQPSVTKVNYFKGSDPEKWKTDISTYDMVNLGEIYKGIDLKLKAYGDNVEKLFCVKPGASPETIQVQLNGAKLLKVNEEGQLVAETELGHVKFTRPVAYQEIDGKRVEVAVEYSIQNPEDVGWVKRTGWVK